ncbi:hypothetical protein ACROYT_G002923 [Oculina patagonica]
MSLGILKNNRIIVSALSLITFVLLNSAGNTEARPTNVSRTNTSNDNDTVEWLRELEDANSAGGEAEKSRVVQLYTSEDNDAIKWLERLEKSQPVLQESGIEDVTSAMVGESDVQQTQTFPNLFNARKARNTNNVCIERYQYRVIYNYFFQIPVCKQGCKKKYKTVAFSNGKTLAIVYDCYI